MRFPILLLASTFLLLPASASAAPKENKCSDTSSSDDESVIARRKRERATALGLHYQAIRKAKPNGEGAIKIPARTIEVPHGKLILEGGYVVPAHPCTHDPAALEGKDVPDRNWNGAIYLGEGRFVYDSPHPSESWQLNYTLEKLGNKGHDREGLEVAIDGGLIFFGSEDWRGKLVEGGEPAELDKKATNAATKMWKSRADMFVRGTARRESSHAFRGNLHEDYLTLDVATKDLKNVPAISYSVDGGVKEEVSSYILRRKNPLNKDDISYSKLSEWFRPETSDGKSDRELALYRMEPEETDLKHYDLDMTVYRDETLGKYGLHIAGTVEIEVLVDGLMGVDLSLLSNTNANGLKVSSLSVEGANVSWFHDSSIIATQFDRPFNKGETIKFLIDCKGPVVQTIIQQAPSGGLDQQSALTSGTANVANYRLPIGAPWFPTAGGNFDDAFTFDWRLHMPKEMVAATSGTMLSDNVDGGVRTMVVKETVPVFFPAIVFGRFNAHMRPADPERGIPVIRLFTHPGFDKEAQLWMDEAAGVIDFYHSLFGRGTYPWQELDMVQMPIGVGYAQAPSGLVQMDGVTFYSKTDLVNLYQADENLLDIRDNFVPHEIGHFWWGHRAGWASSRDQWASETLAEYSAALYIERREQARSGDPEDLSGYEHRRKRWGAEGRRGHTFKRTGPVWIANTIDGSEELSPRRTASIYARGPLIFDMLRQQFGKEFVLKVLFALNEVWAKNENKAITEDLSIVLAQLAPGYEFDEFLERYIKGNEPLPDDPKKSVADKQGKYKF